ncbi:unnamed protein product [Adineta ricciae]|uniref:G-protein coupled receptors family 1 profile domain-containing protein n=1 Tax=Adineta ricciae TaxID=249248 RepID=A0A815NQK7_ADIRI|nr:unnamed protein product [Adineta ricciae]
MSSIDSYPVNENLLQQQQQSLYSSVSPDIQAYPLNDMTEIDLTEIVQRNTNRSTTIDIVTHFQYSSLILKISLGLICACLCLLTITGNLLVLITFRRIRTVGNLFILSLATADLIVGCFVMPIAGIYAIMENWNMGLLLCQIWLSVDFTASTASIFNLLTLSLDRYWSITSPLQYLGKRTRTRALFLIGLAWGLSVLWVIPIFGWHRLVNHDTRYIDSTKCEPEYTHSKVFKVSTAIINFYLPLLVLMSLNGRMYFEIKRRYKNALLQRYSSRSTSDSPNTCKLHSQRKNSRIPVTIAICDTDKQLCPTSFNFIDADTLAMTKPISTNHYDNTPTLRVNYKEKKNRPILTSHLSISQPLPKKTSYPFIEKNHCAQDELVWFAHHERSRSSLSPMPTPRSHRTGSKYRLNVDERCFKHSYNCPTCPIYTNEQVDLSPKHHRDSYQYYPASHRTTLVCHRCSFDNRRASTATTTKTNVFNLCQCFSSATSALTIDSNLDPYENTRKISASSASSSTSRRQRAMSSYSLARNSMASNIIPHSSSYQCTRSASKMKQATVWNQQEKAFRQLFAIVFGFTVCFLPYFILYMVVAFCGSCVSERFLTVTIWLGYVNSTINPFLYALSNKHFRRTFNRILKRDHRRQSYYN